MVIGSPERALELREQTPPALTALREHWAFWLRLVVVMW